MRTLNLAKSTERAATAGTADAVRLLQERLTANGWELKVDGIPGPKTLEAFYQFQAANGLTVDGICGPASWERLLSVRVDPTHSFSTLLRASEKLAIEEMLAGIEQATLGLALGAPERRGAAAVKLAVEDWYGVAEVPDGANTGPRLRELVEGYNEYWGITDGKMRPWCAMAVSQWIRLSMSFDTVWSDTPMKRWFGGVAQFEAWAKERKIFYAAVSAHKRVALPGEIFTMGRAGSGSDPSKTVKAGHTG